MGFYISILENALIRKKFIVNTLPKGGSHLLIKCLKFITNKHPNFIGGPHFVKEQTIDFLDLGRYTLITLICIFFAIY